MRVAVHIGLHKTATTTLQRQVFPFLGGVNFIDSAKSPAGPVLYRLQVQDPIYFDSAQAREILVRVLSSDAINLISAESLSGSLYSSIGKRDLDHRHSIIENLRETLPEAKIVLVLRRQDQYAKSVYRQYIKRGGVLDPISFFGRSRDEGAFFPRDRFRYLEYVTALQERFQAGVFVGLFEEFVEAPSRFLDRMCKFLEAIPATSWKLRQTNRSRLGSFGLELSRHLNRLFSSPLNPAGLLPGLPRRRRAGGWWSVSPVFLLQDHWPGSGRVTDHSRLGRVCREILAEQAAGNRLLQEQLSIDLQKFGYC